MLNFIAIALGLSKNAWTVVSLIVHMIREIEADPQFSKYIAELAQLLRDALTKQDRANLVKDIAPDAPVSALSAFMASLRKWIETPD